MLEANTFIGSYYVTGLRAGAQMATLMGETSLAAKCGAAPPHQSRHVIVVVLVVVSARVGVPSGGSRFNLLERRPVELSLGFGVLDALGMKVHAPPILGILHFSREARAPPSLHTARRGTAAGRGARGKFARFRDAFRGRCAGCGDEADGY